MDQAFEPGISTLFVFSHPNHELALFGLSQRLRPHFVFLTDGGGQDRIEQTSAGLESLGLLSRATFLNHPEDLFYDRILERDSAFFDGVAGQVREVMDRVSPERVFCDAVEFYNPVHDIALPVTRAALKGHKGNPQVFEVPLVYQEPSSRGVSYVCQRVPGSHADLRHVFQLAGTEQENKTRARDSIYTLLRSQMGPTLQELTPEYMGVEQVLKARKDVPEVPADQILRYEWRAEKLLKENKISRAIRYSEHYVPVAKSLFS